MRKRRHELDLSPGHVAERLFISGKTLERWERGETMGAIRAIDKVADVLETTEEKLLAGYDENKPDETPDPFANGAAEDDDLAGIKAELAAVRTELAAMKQLLDMLAQHATEQIDEQLVGEPVSVRAEAGKGTPVAAKAAGPGR